MKRITMTHIGNFYGDARVGDRKLRLYLRKTKNYWIEKNGGRFNKKTGRGTGDWPIWSLDIPSVKKLTKPIIIEI